MAWLIRWEACEEIKLLPAYRVAWRHHREHLMHTAFVQLKAYCRRRRQCNSRNELARAFYRTSALPVFFQAWRERTAMQVHTRSQLQRADGLYAEHMLARFVL